MQAKESVRQFILKNYLFSADESDLKDQESLIKGGVLDSTGVLELIMFLQEQFSIEVADEEMIPENLDSVHSIVAFVARKRA